MKGNVFIPHISFDPEADLELDEIRGLVHWGGEEVLSDDWLSLSSMIFPISLIAFEKMRKKVMFLGKG